MDELPVSPAEKREDYWSLARQPLNCFVFLLPLLAAYELGVWMVSTGDGSRNGADYWMRGALRLAGFEHPALLPLLVIGLLAFRHVSGRFRWKLSPATLLGMCAESALFGVCLVVLGQLQDLAFHSHAPRAQRLAVPLSQPGMLPLVVSYLGAGVYEEVLFRVCLFKLGCGAFRVLLIPRQAAVVLAVIVSSLLFSAAHYVGPAADDFTLFTFCFRAMAGVFFCVLFVWRGFGISVGSHAAYDLLVGILIPAMAI